MLRNWQNINSNNCKFPLCHTRIVMYRFLLMMCRSPVIKGILSASCVIFLYPKLLSISVLTFIKWRLTPRIMLQKIRFFDKKRPKTIVIRIIVWMTIFKSIHMAFYVNTSWACVLFRNNKQDVERESVNAWKKADFDGFREKGE